MLTIIRQPAPLAQQCRTEGGWNLWEENLKQQPLFHPLLIWDWNFQMKENKSFFFSRDAFWEVLKVLANAPFLLAALFQDCGERCTSLRNFLLKSSGRHCALPVAYLSNVTPHVSRCLKKTPASAFTPISHSHISFPRPLRLPFHFLLHCSYCKVKMVCYQFISKSCSAGSIFTIVTDLCVFWRRLRGNFMNL